jgi:hypothetical protein
MIVPQEMLVDTFLQRWFAISHQNLLDFTAGVGVNPGFDTRLLSKKPGHLTGLFGSVTYISTAYVDYCKSDSTEAGCWLA